MHRKQRGTPLSDPTLAALTPDPHNANLGTERGMALLEKSLRQHGAGRSIVVDRNGVVICGSKTLEQWAALADDAQIQVVHSDGHALVVVQRDDLDLSDPQGAARQLAYLDNRSSELSLAWDVARIADDLQAGVDLAALWRQDELDQLVASVAQSVPAQVADRQSPLVTCPACGHLFQSPTEKETR